VDVLLGRRLSSHSEREKSSREESLPYGTFE